MRAIVLCSSLAVAGCGGGAPAPADLAAAPDLAQPPPDLSTVTDLAPPPADLAMSSGSDGSVDPKLPGVQCKNVTCPMGDVCCVDPNAMSASCTAPAACPMSSASFACDGPEDCGGNTTICCATIKVGGSGLNCTFQGGVAVCAANCPTMLAGCPTTEVVKVCHTSADCAIDQANPNCCELAPGLLGCISDVAKTITNPTCY